jgi:hypothetical protein
MRLLPIAKPCKAPFAAMSGDDQTRFCPECDKHVHDLSARTEEEARAFLASARGTRICVRFARDARGNVRFRAAAMAAAMSLASCASAAPEAPPATAAAPAQEEDHDQGDMIPDSVDLCPADGTSSGVDGCPEAAPPASSAAPK